MVHSAPCLLFVNWTLLCPNIQSLCDAAPLGLPTLCWQNIPAPKFTVTWLLALHWLNAPMQFTMMPLIQVCLLFVDWMPLCPSLRHSFKFALHQANAPMPKFPTTPLIWICLSLSTEHPFLLRSYMPFHMSGNDATAFLNTYTDIVSVVVLKTHWNVNIMSECHFQYIWWEWVFYSFLLYNAHSLSKIVATIACPIWFTARFASFAHFASFSSFALLLYEFEFKYM